MLLAACVACDNGAPKFYDAGVSQAGPAGSGTPTQTATSGAGPTSIGTAGTGAHDAGQAGNSAAGSGGSAGTGSGGMAGNAMPDDMDSGVEEPPARSTGPGDWVAGDYPKDLTGPDWLELSNIPGQDGNVRQYKVHVPAGYDPKVPMPVVFCIHGLGQDGLLFCVDGASMPAKSDAAGFILVMPNGFENSWNAGTCCGGAAAAQLDDVAFFRAIFAEISKHLNIDLTRVYATGLSNGGYMSYRLACEAGDLFVAVAPGAGAFGMDDIGGGTTADGDLESCMPAKPVSVLDIHGTDDPLVAYSTQKPSLDRIAEKNGCKLTTHPASQPASQGDTTCVSYDCPSGVDVTGCTVQGGGHVWFGSQNCGTGVDFACAIVGANSTAITNTDAVWTFLSAHARN
jgi:polyhydroxybutyrate depolymerase